jgi:hypothetical protein
MRHYVHSCEGGLNTSTAALRVLEGDEKGTQCLGYNWATRSLRDINTGAWSSRLGAEHKANDDFAVKNTVAKSKEVKIGWTDTLRKAMAQKGLFCR